MNEDNQPQNNHPEDHPHLDPDKTLQEPQVNLTNTSMDQSSELDQVQPVQISPRLNLEPVQQKIDALMSECRKFIVGQEELLELMLACILADGHILLEGVPGIAKTLSARVLSKTIDSAFSRIQFTPDLMPSDILGTSIFNMKESEFVFKKGPIFSNVVLIDEINRAPAKTQSALFEVMEEKQISYDGEVYDMDFPFIVLATQNPIEQEGTYRLPEAQLDRFLMKIVLDYPSQHEELDILRMYKNQVGKLDLAGIDPVLRPSDIKDIQDYLLKINIEDQMLSYITDIIAETRQHAKLFLGGSPRASLAILKTSKVIALLAGRDFVIPDDIQYVCPHVLNHRIMLSPDAEMEGLSTMDVIKEILQSIEVPR